jgi:cytochrome c-type biogenesis protein CcmH
MVVVAPDAAAQELIQEANTARRARKHAAARDAYVKLVARGAMTADTWADYADVTASLRGGTLAGEAGKYIARALELDPRHAKALWLQGSLLHETGRHSEAVAVWERLASVLDPGTSDARLVADNIAEDRRLGGSASGSAASTVKPAAAAAAVAVSGEVVVAEALKSQVTAGQTVFIYAKAAGQSAPPVAALRTASGAWPLRFRLDDSLSMMPSRPLSAAGKLIIEARISRSGEATALAGDLQGTSGVIDPKSGAPLRLLIDRVVN